MSDKKKELLKKTASPGRAWGWRREGDGRAEAERTDQEVWH